MVLETPEMDSGDNFKLDLYLDFFLNFHFFIEKIDIQTVSLENSGFSLIFLTGQ